MAMPLPEPDDISTLERMRRRLYAPEAPETLSAPAALKPVPPPAPASEGWVPPQAEPVPAKKRGFSWPAMFLGIAALFFILAIGAAAYFLVFGSRAVSTDSIVITVDAPPTMRSGDEITLLVSVENRNPVAALETMLSVDLPDTARSPENPDVPVTFYEDTVGDIAPGETGNRSVRALLYGSENERFVIPVRFEYRIEGSNATFVKETEYEVEITSSPLSVRAEAVSEIAVGQPLAFAVTVRSNAAEPLQNVAVAVAQPYPAGFSLRRGEGPVFPVGTLLPGEERTITVTGTIAGENSEERFFRFAAGLASGEGAAALSATYSTATAPVTLAKPFLQPTLAVNRDTGSAPIIAAGTAVQNTVTWVNTLAGPVLDGRVEVRLTGDALDPASVSAYGGFYRSSDTTIVYSRETDNGLANLAPGATGTGTFSFRTKPAATLANAGTRSPTVVATVSVAGRRVGESNVPESVPSSLVRTMKVATDLVLSGNALYSTGPFRNTGPWPPVADQETTYAVRLSLTNSVNTVADATVSGTLPSYVRYVGATDPADGSISYNAATRTVTWRAGEVAAGTGFATSARTSAFQVALLPSASQRGTSPVLMSGITVSGVDRFTQGQIQTPHPEITTRATADPAFVQGKGEVR